MHNSTLAASEVHKSVAIGDSEVVEGAGQHMPGRRQIEDSTTIGVLGLNGGIRGVEPPVQHACCQFAVQQ